jgi:cation diffusion facilitator CzcD-associated flavoprotein CzcO
MPNFKNEFLFKGKIKHLKEIQLHEEFTDKNICIVDSGQSASEMILVAAKFGKKSFLSIRNYHGDRYGPADLDTSRVPRAFRI